MSISYGGGSKSAGVSIEMQTAQGIFKLWSGSHQSRRNIPKADVEGWTRRATRSQQRQPRGVLTASHFVFVPPLDSNPPPSRQGLVQVTATARCLGMGAGPTAACRAGLLCRALLAQEVNGPSIRCYSTTGVHASQIPRVQGGGLLPWTVPPAHAVQLDLRPANRGPGGVWTLQHIVQHGKRGLGPATTIAPIWTQGLGTIGLSYDNACGYSLLRGCTYLFAHTIQEGDPRTRSTDTIHPLCRVPCAAHVVYNQTRSSQRHNERCEMRHGRHRQQRRSPMANPHDRACGSEANNQADDMMCTLLHGRRTSKSSWWGRNTAAWRLMTRGRALVLAVQPQPVAQSVPTLGSIQPAVPPPAREPQPASPPNRSLHPHSPPTSSSSSFRWLPDLDALDGMSTRNSLACPTLASHCLFVLAHGLHTDTRPVYAVLLRK